MKPLFPNEIMSSIPLVHVNVLGIRVRFTVVHIYFSMNTVTGSLGKIIEIPVLNGRLPVQQIKFLINLGINIYVH